MTEDFDFYQPEENTIGQYIQPYPGNEQNIKERSVIISGFPYD